MRKCGFCNDIVRGHTYMAIGYCSKSCAIRAGAIPALARKEIIRIHPRNGPKLINSGNKPTRDRSEGIHGAI